MSGPSYPGEQNPYQPRPMGPETTKFARIDPGPSQTFGAVGALITVVGAVLVVLAFTVLDWFSGGRSGFSDIRTTMNAVGSDVFSTPARLYFGWLGWTLLAVATVLALIAAIPTVGSAFRMIAPVVAAAGIVVTFLAIKLTNGDLHIVGVTAPGYGDYLRNARAGFYVALAGFLLIGVGGALGPQNKRA